MLKERFLRETLDFLEEREKIKDLNTKGQYQDLAENLFKTYPKLYDAVFEDCASSDNEEELGPRVSILNSRN